MIKNGTELRLIRQTQNKSSKGHFQKKCLFFLTEAENLIEILVYTNFQAKPLRLFCVMKPIQTPDWLDTNEYPFSPNTFQTEGQRMHYIDVGPRQAPVLLFVHGTPSWSFDFRKVLKTCSNTFRCIAMDHIGFGLSDKPETFDYSTKGHARRLKQLIQYLKLPSVHLIAHDFGGVISMAAFKDFPEKVNQIVFLNTWLWDCSKEPEFRKIKWILQSPLLPFLYRYLNFSAKYVLPSSFFDKNALPKTVHQQYLLPFAASDTRTGTIAFARSLLKDQPWFQQIWEETAAFRSKKLLLIWGKQDPAVPFRYAERFQQHFLQSHLVGLEQCGHFPQEEQSEKVSQEILRFLV